MEHKINPFFFCFAVVITLGVLLGASIMLPHDRYYRFQAHNDVTTRKADWIYERLHYDPTPIDVALIGTSRIAGGLSGPLIEHSYCQATGRRIHVANLAIPVTGRNMHYVIAKIAARTKAPMLYVVELNEIESRRPHAGFIFLADASDVLTAPILLNLNYIKDLLRLPGRQASLFIEGITGKPAIRTAFDPQEYAGPHLDRTENIISIDGQNNSRRVSHARSEMDAMRAERMKDVSPLHLLPKPLRAFEYRFSRYYFRKIEALSTKFGGDTAYTYVPAYGADMMPLALIAELGIGQAIIDLGGDIAKDASMWLDATHLNTDGAVNTSEKFAAQLASAYPALGVEERCRYDIGQ